MATGKRYYWIKLKDSFMSSDEIDYLMSQPDGANYVVLYQMLCLKTINTNGCLVSKIGEMLIPYDAEKIQRECKWFPLSTVRLALTVYKQIGLIFENPDGTLSISDYQNMIGSETDWAAKNRKIRSNAANKELQAGHDTGHTTGHNVSTDGGENVPTEKEIEKDKDIENRERVRDNGSPTVDAGLAEIIRSFEEKLLANRLPTRIASLSGQPAGLTLQKRSGADHCYDFSADLQAADGTTTASVTGTITMVKEDGAWKASDLTLNLK